MALFDDFSDGVKKVLLAGVGAVALGAEKSQDVVEDLIKRGELTVEQGKALNDELQRKVRETTTEMSDEVLRAHLRSMAPEDRAAWIARAQRIAEELAQEEAAAEVEDEEPEASYEVADEDEADGSVADADAEPAVESEEPEA